MLAHVAQFMVEAVKPADEAAVVQILDARQEALARLALARQGGREALKALAAPLLLLIYTTFRPYSCCPQPHTTCQCVLQLSQPASQPPCNAMQCNAMQCKQRPGQHSTAVYLPTYLPTRHTCMWCTKATIQ